MRLLVFTLVLLAPAWSADLFRDDFSKCPPAGSPVPSAS